MSFLWQLSARVGPPSFWGSLYAETFDCFLRALTGPCFAPWYSIHSCLLLLPQESPQGCLMSTPVSSSYSHLAGIHPIASTPTRNCIPRHHAQTSLQISKSPFQPGLRSARRFSPPGELFTPGGSGPLSDAGGLQRGPRDFASGLFAERSRLAHCVGLGGHKVSGTVVLMVPINDRALNGFLGG